jgi:hypothetical protein
MSIAGVGGQQQQRDAKRIHKPVTGAVNNGSGHRSNSWVKLKSPAARDRDRRRVALTRR